MAAAVTQLRIVVFRVPRYNKAESSPALAVGLLAWQQAVGSRVERRIF